MRTAQSFATSLFLGLGLITANAFESSQKELLEQIHEQLSSQWKVQLNKEMLTIQFKKKIRLISNYPSSPPYTDEELQEISFMGHYAIKFRLAPLVSPKEYVTAYKTFWAEEKEYEQAKRDLHKRGVRMGKGQLYPEGDEQKKWVQELKQQFKGKMKRYPNYYFKNLSVYDVFHNYDAPLKDEDVDRVETLYETLNKIWTEYKRPPQSP